MGLIWCMMYDVWCMMRMMYDMDDVWCKMYDSLIAVASLIFEYDMMRRDDGMITDDVCMMDDEDDGW